MTDKKDSQTKHATNLPLIWIVIATALLVSLVSLYFTFSSQSSLKLAQKEEKQITTTLEGKVQALSSSQEKSSKTNQQLQETIQRLIKENHIERNYWQLMKARHLIETAQTTLKWDKDVTPALFLLESADKLLASPLTADTTDIRKELNQAIISLKALPTIDTVGLLSQLDGISKAAGNCQLKTERTNSTNIDTATKKEVQNESGWKKTLNTSLNKLSKLVIIRYRKDKKAPLISLQEKALVVKKIQLTLSEAKWAVIRQEQPLYDYSLKQAILEVEDAFDDNDVATKSLLSALQSLKKQTISIHTIDISPTLHSLEKLIQGERT